jgi:trehalose/maltose transport system substrate-binding protein
MRLIAFAESEVGLMHGTRGSIFRYAGLAVLSLILVGFGGCRRRPEPAVTVRFLQDGWVPTDDLPAARAATEEFAHQTSIELELIRGVPAETVDQLALIRKLMNKRAEGPDVVEVDQAWLGTLKDDLIDLRPFFPNEAGSLSPALASSYIIGGSVLAIPYLNQAGVLRYRDDLLRKYGYDHPPRTWTELETMALRIQTSERAHGNKDFWGYIWPGAAEESLTCNALEWQVDEGGGRIIESDGAISVNNPAAIRAWQRARHWMGWISPPAVAEYREEDVRNAFESGRSAFVRVWAAEAGGLSTRERPELQAFNWSKSPAVGEQGFAAMPAGSVAQVAVLGGSGVAISKYSTHPQEDATLIRFVLRKELESFQNRSRSRRSVIYDAADVQGSISGFSSAVTLRAAVIARPTSVSAQHYEQVSRAYSGAVHSVLTGKKKASDAAFELEQDLVRITGLRAGPPANE